MSQFLCQLRRQACIDHVFQLGIETALHDPLLCAEHLGVLLVQTLGALLQILQALLLCAESQHLIN